MIVKDKTACLLQGNYNEALKDCEEGDMKMTICIQPWMIVAEVKQQQLDFSL